MASMVAVAKEQQGYREVGPACRDCAHFKHDTKVTRPEWTTQIYIKDINLRCGIGGFKVHRMGWCKQYRGKE